MMNTSRSIALVWALCAGATSLVGCGDSGTDSVAGGGTSAQGGGDAGGGGAGGEQPGCSVATTDTCGTCMADTCCDAYAACEADATCWGCVTGDDPDACGSTPASHELQTAYLECLGGPCNDACIGSSGACDEAADVYAPACGECLETNCCEELGACFAHEGCWVDCVTDHNAQGCHEPNAHALFYALGSCAQSSCSEACSSGPDFEPACEGLPDVAPSVGSCVVLGGNNACNPITNEGCTEKGHACDVNEAGDGFACFPPPNDQELCATCGSQEGYCLPGHTCAGSCVRYCCSAEDCGPGGTCDLEILEGLAGLCVVPAP